MRRSQRRVRGQALVEFALVVPILLLVLVGILDFGRAIFAYNSVSNAARSGARVAIVDQSTTAIEAAVEAEAVGLEPTTVITFTDGGTTCAPVEIGCMASVSVEHDFEPATPLLGSIIGPLTVSSTAQMAVERAYVSP